MGFIFRSFVDSACKIFVWNLLKCPTSVETFSNFQKCHDNSFYNRSEEFEILIPEKFIKVSNIIFIFVEIEFLRNHINKPHKSRWTSQKKRKIKMNVNTDQILWEKWDHTMSEGEENLNIEICSSFHYNSKLMMQQSRWNIKIKEGGEMWAVLIFHIFSHLL